MTRQELQPCWEADNKSQCWTAQPIYNNNNNNIHVQKPTHDSVESRYHSRSPTPPGLPGMPAILQNERSNRSR
ncbi:hypothetical protein ZHAS_00015371 [Anopheles sinensis]|uniref:Uncharacterized protein n=1 Tax=Anopheles sinensis TaxID=74873 RepID=A0A084WAT9_ANOSI|nr:hypothetical protein ZHAS_00015371 [Anopheles sinensis]